MRIGIVVPAYNAAPWIGDAIASVIAQKFRDWRMVVVDDGSTDPTGDVVGSFGDPRVRLVRQPNAGVSIARNRGLAELCRESPDAPVGGGTVVHLPLPLPDAGKRDALLFLDADDRLAPDALSRLVTALDRAPDAVAAAGAFAFEGLPDVRDPPSGDLLERLLVRNLFANGGHLLLRCSDVLAAGGFCPGLAFGEDWEFWIRLALRGTFATAPERRPVLYVRQHQQGAYRRLATDPAAFEPCMQAIFGNLLLLARFGPQRLAAIRRHTESENQWIIGRELIRHGRSGEGIAWLRRSVLTHPMPKRAALLAAAYSLPLLPPTLRGPFRPYRWRTKCNA
jgi:glycosyltransferase involved in cell wall biosynthesis